MSRAADRPPVGTDGLYGLIRILEGGSFTPWRLSISLHQCVKTSFADRTDGNVRFDLRSPRRPEVVEVVSGDEAGHQPPSPRPVWPYPSGSGDAVHHEPHYIAQLRHQIQVESLLNMIQLGSPDFERFLYTFIRHSAFQKREDLFGVLR